MRIEKVSISEQALSDLEEIWQYIETDNPSAADALIDTIYKKCMSLKEFPEMGRVRDEVLPEVRSILVEKYLIFYRINNNIVEIARVLSGYRDIDTLF